MPHEFYAPIFRQLNAHKVKYLVAGGVAVGLYGYLRATKDLDMLVDLTRPNLLRLGKAMKALGYQPQVPVQPEALANARQRRQWHREKGMMVFSFVQNEFPFNHVDVMISSPISFAKAYPQRRVMQVCNVQVPLVGIEHLKQMKRHAGRGIDLIDVEGLEHIR